MSAILDIEYKPYTSELQLPDIMRLIGKDLSEPYSIYTYRFFVHNWPELCFLAHNESDECVGVIVCKLDVHCAPTRSTESDDDIDDQIDDRRFLNRGYIAMLAVDERYRRKQIGTNLVRRAIESMQQRNCDEVVLETEASNSSALQLYERLGFVRARRLHRYYLNGGDAYRLKLWLPRKANPLPYDRLVELAATNMAALDVVAATDDYSQHDPASSEEGALIADKLVQPVLPEELALRSDDLPQHVIKSPTLDESGLPNGETVTGDTAQLVERTENLHISDAVS